MATDRKPPDEQLAAIAAAAQAVGAARALNRAVYTHVGILLEELEAQDAMLAKVSGALGGAEDEVLKVIFPRKKV